MKKKELHTEKHPFKSDDAYFERLEDNILAKVTGNQFHLPLGLNHPFKAPEGYFLQLEAEVLTNIERQTSKQTESTGAFIGIWRNYSRAIRIAATFLAFAVAGLFIYRTNQPTATTFDESQLASVDSETISDYLENEPLSFNDLALAVESTDLMDAESLLPAEHLQEANEDELLQLIDFQYSDDI